MYYLSAFFHRIIYLVTYPFQLLLYSPGRIFAGPGRLFRISLPARVAIAVAVVLIICVVATLLAFYYTQDRSNVSVKLTFGFVLAVSILVVVIPIVLYKALKLWLEGDVSPFPDIDNAWRAGLAELQQHNLDLSQIPLFLVLGSAGEDQEKSLFDASRLSLNLREVPQGPAALHWYANPDGIYLVSTDTSCLSKLAGLARKLTDEESSRPGPIKPRSSVDPIRGTIVSGGAGGRPPGGELRGSAPLPESPAAQAPSGPVDIRGTMIVGGQVSGAAAFDSGGVTTSAEKRVIKLQQHDGTEQERRLEYVCRLIRRARQPLCPINGLLTLLPFGLIQRSIPESIEVQRALKRDLSTLLRVLMLRCPATAMVVGLEEESGFRELVRRVGRDRALGQRFGKGFTVWNPPIPERLEALSAHACGSFEDWVYTLFREKGSLSKPGNTKLYALLCKIRRNVQSRLANILVAAFSAQTDQDPQTEGLLFGGCYFAASGESEDRQAFVRGVFDKLPEQQEELQWTRQGLDEDEKFQRFAQLGFGLDMVLLLGLAGMIVYKWLL